MQRRNFPTAARPWGRGKGASMGPQGLGVSLVPWREMVIGACILEIPMDGAILLKYY